MYVGNQLARIHIGKKALCLDDDEYCAFLFGLTGKTSSKEMDVAERTLVINEMKKRGAFKRKPLTGQQKACVAKWYKLRQLGEVKSKDKSALNKFIKKHLGKTQVAHLNSEETNQLLGMLQGWLAKVEHRCQHANDSIID